MTWEEATRALNDSVFPNLDSRIWDHIRSSRYTPETAKYTFRKKKDENHKISKYKAEGKIGLFDVTYEYSWCHICKAIKRQWAVMYDDMHGIAYVHTWFNHIANQEGFLGAY